MNRLWATIPALLVLASAFGGGCQSIIGLEDRSIDPSLSTGGATAQAGARQTGGNQATGTGGSSSGDAGAAGAGEMTPCEEYCALTTANCRNECPPTNLACDRDLSVYSSPTICMNVCEELEVGDLDDPQPGNTLACRLEQARFAGIIADEAWAHCPAAGPGGAGVCGDNCESYCSLMDRFCSEDFPEYIDPECLAKCSGLRNVDLDSGLDATASRYGSNLHHDGDFLQCRLVHVSSASEAPSTHCWHSAIEPKPLAAGALNPCADRGGTTPRCEDYCHLVMAACPGDLAVYEDEEQCLDACETLDPGDAVDAGGQNTVGCRRNHSYNAMLGGSDVHCPHAGPGGNGVCGDNCASYCTMLASACEDDFTTEAECLDECADLEGAAAGSAYAVTTTADGDNFQCRLLAVVRAFGDDANCEDALGGGACQD